MRYIDLPDSEDEFSSEELQSGMGYQLYCVCASFSLTQ